MTIMRQVVELVAVAADWAGRMGAGTERNKKADEAGSVGSRIVGDTALPDLAAIDPAGDVVATTEARPDAAARHASIDRSHRDDVAPARCSRFGRRATAPDSDGGGAAP